MLCIIYLPTVKRSSHLLLCTQTPVDVQHNSILFIFKKLVHNIRNIFSSTIDLVTLSWKRTRLLLDSRLETGSNTCTVALRVVGGDEKGTKCLRA
jgi:hypothetical protein